MRACWIDTSAMFRTVRGFFETTRLTMMPRRHTPVSFEEACSHARQTDEPMPEAFASAK